MKTSRTKSFRLHHINKTSEMRKTSQSFMEPNETFKLAALNSVSRGVKKADLSLMTGSDLNKLRIEPIQAKNGEQLSAHGNLMDVRLRYDEMKKKNMMSELHIKNLKEQKNKLEIFKKQYEDRQSIARGKVDCLEQRLTAIKNLLEETSTEEKVLQSLRFRHNSDKVVFDQRKFDLEQELAHKRKQIGIYRKEDKQELESQDRTSKIYDKLQSQLQEEQFEREEHIKNLQIMIEEKMALNNVNSQREVQLAEIASRAIQDKMQTQKHWRMVYLTNVFVNKMLRNKIDAEMLKFKTVESAFKTIKTATGVSNAKSLVSKYLNKEAVYGELLGKIADNQRIISDLKGEGEKLVQESKELEAEKEVLQSTRIKQLDLHDEVKQYQIQAEKATVAYKLGKKLDSWVQRQFKKMLAVSGKSEKVSDNFGEAVKDFLERMSKLLEESEGQAEGTEVGGSLNSEKVVRVMPKKSRKNSVGEQIFDVDEEELNPGLSNEETEFINSQHDGLVSNNDKFMKQLRKKFEEERKLLIQKEQSKAKSPVKAPEPKKQQE